MTAAAAPLGWFGIVRLGLVQAAIGAIVAMTTSLLNRVMVVEYALPAMLPAALVGWHYAVQLTRPRWGHGSDRSVRRVPWITGGMAVLALGAVLATGVAGLIAADPWIGIPVAALAFAMIGLGVGAAGTTLLALLASLVAPERRAGAASLTWIMMVAGIVAATATASSLLEPFSPQRLMTVAGGVVLVAFAIACIAVRGLDRTTAADAPPAPVSAQASFGAALAAIWDDRAARRLTVFIFVSMLAYSTQDMILEPFAGLVFGFTPAQSTGLASVQHMGVLIGMVLVGTFGNRFGAARDRDLRGWIIAGCLGSAVALAAIALAGAGAVAGVLTPLVFVLGFANGVFAVAAIATMMALAGADGGGREGIRMGLWGAAQAIAFGLGGFLGAAGADVGRALLARPADAFALVFAVEAGLFLLSTVLAARLSGTRPATSWHPAIRGAVA